jgi:TonB-dependent starch-binding outer membrane protein SusC
MKGHVQLKNLLTVALIAFALLTNVHEVFAQKRTVSGQVKDDTGSALPGVSVLEKGTSNGAVTDVEGKFTISVNENATLAISFIGMEPQEVAVGNRNSIDVTLKTDVTQLEEVVVIGYGTAKKSDLTGSVVSVTGDDLKKVPVSTVAESLTGRMAGVQVSSTEGSPDAEIRIRVRGGGSITQNNSPLLIVDGFPVNSINDITPSDIKSIDVLKDASSTAIYGSRGANGVIIITTKTGRADKLTVSYNSFFAAKKIAKTMDVLEPEDYAKWQYEYAMLKDDLPSYQTYFGSFQDLDLYANKKGNNWQKQVYGRTGQVFSNDISIRGGSDKFNYSANYARYNERAIMVGSGYNRDNITLKVNNKPHENIDLAFSLRYSNTKIGGSGANEQNEVSSADSRLKHSIGYTPLPIPGLTKDDTNEQSASDLVNPLLATADNDRDQQRKNYNLAGSFTWRPIENLEWRTDFGLDSYNYLDNRFYGLTTYYTSNVPSAENQRHPAVVLNNRNEERFRNTNTVSYNFKKLLGGEHNARLLVGQELIKSEVSQLTSVVHGFPTLFTSNQAFKLTTQGVAQSTDNNYSPDDKLLSFFGRVNYDFKGKYLLSATYRADGSSRFLGSNRWGYFPSAAAAWKISDEQFMQGMQDLVNFLKLRVSYGAAGNNNIPTGQTVQSFQSSSNTWIDGFNNYWSASKVLANPDLKWETTTTRDIGIDFGLLKSRLTGTFDAYLNNTTDLLIAFPVSGTGYDTQYRNIGETENRGLEASLSYAAIDKKDYGLSFSVNMSFNRGKVKSLGELDEIIGEGTTSGWASTAIGYDYKVSTGNPIGLMYGYRSDGRYEVSDFNYDANTATYTLKDGVADDTQIVGAAAPGKMKLKDLNGDGLVTTDDREIIGNANPKHTGGLIINGYAYGFDLTAAFSYSYGNKIYNANKIEFTSSTTNTQYRNLFSDQADGTRWTNIDPATGALVTDPTALTSLNANTTMWSPYMSRYVFSDWAVEDGSFLRLNTLSLGYTLPSSITSRMHINSLRFYVTGYNLFVLTNYTGFDPEVSTRRKTALTPGVDYSAYPRSRQLTVGLNLNF